MPPFFFRCPITGSRVQGILVEEAPSDPDFYSPVTCLACGLMHLVNLKTGKTVGKTPPAAHRSFALTASLN
jgi:hypothetical protein